MTLDNQLLEHLLSYLTERRKELFKEVCSKRTKHFTVVTEDVYQLHNTSAVMRSCDVFGIQELHVIEEKLELTFVDYEFPIIASLKKFKGSQL